MLRKKPVEQFLPLEGTMARVNLPQLAQNAFIGQKRSFLRMASSPFKDTTTFPPLPTKTLAPSSVSLVKALQPRAAENLR